ncbi:Ku protein [Paramicrobacterium fandaimingii]|uniref:non-homologous end joining protein Ku n=1 Tax=Paramicrobacterium fandaimingii TaxID=2708079 RepID=UPI0014245CAB|nr:Ku protein [Microbacterium fandaimingii]
MRAIWTGAISFGLVNVPVKLYSATEKRAVTLHQVHDADGGRIHNERRCDVCGRTISYDHIEKAHVDDDETVVLTKKELDALPQERSKEISVVEFVPSKQIDPILYDKSYFLEPTGKSLKAYVLLRRTLEKTDRTAIVQLALRQRTRLAALRVRGDMLMVQTLRWPEEIREPSFPALDEKVRVSAKEMDLSASLVKTYAADFSPEDFHDEYEEELEKLIDAKLKQGEALDTDATFGEVDGSEGAEVVDLMEALKKSVKKSRASKRGGQARKTSKKSASSAQKKTSGSSSRARKGA